MPEAGSSGEPASSRRNAPTATTTKVAKAISAQASTLRPGRARAPVAPRPSRRRQAGPGAGVDDGRRSQPLSANRPAAIAQAPAPKNAPASGIAPAALASSRAAAINVNNAARPHAAATRARGGRAARRPGRGGASPASSAPFSSAGTGARPAWRSISRITPSAVTKPATAPTASVSASGCRRSAVVPTAPTHHVRRPSMISDA